MAYVAANPGQEVCVASTAIPSRVLLLMMGLVGFAVLAVAPGATASTICSGPAGCNITPTLPPTNVVGPPPGGGLPIVFLVEDGTYFAFLDDANLAATNTFGVSG